jgi:membrane protein
MLLSGELGNGESPPIIWLSIIQIVLWLAFQIILTVTIWKHEVKPEGLLPYALFLVLSIFWPQEAPIALFGTEVVMRLSQLPTLAIVLIMINKVEWPRLRSLLGQEGTWYPIVPLVSLGISILQLVDRIPVLLRLWNILDYSKSDFYWRLFEGVDQEVLLVILLSSFLIIKNQKVLIGLSCLYACYYLPSVLIDLLVLKTTAPIPFYHSVISLYLVYRQKESLQKLFGMQPSTHTDKEGTASGNEEATDEWLESQSSSYKESENGYAYSSLLATFLSLPKRLGYPNYFSLIREKLFIAPLVKLFGNHSSDNGEVAVTQGLEAGQEQPTVDLAVEQDNNSKQSFENSRQPVNGVLTNKGNASSLYSYLFALPKWLGLTYYGLGIIGLLLTGPLAFIFFYATCVHLILFTIGFVLTQFALNIDSRLLWSTSSIFYVLSVVVGLILPLQLLSFSVFIVVILGAIFWEKRPKVLRDRW